MATELMTCTEEYKGWPRSSAEVSINLINEYMDHAEECAYHAELMLLEEKEMEKELQFMFRLARGLDSHGRLLRGTMLIEAIAENERRLESWNEAQVTTSPFNRVALYNGGREIASCGSFCDFSRHESVNELDPHAGLQIRGIDGREEESVLLGSYALAGVRHEGDEQTLPLMNGYTVGLRVIRLDEKTFAVGFRCVESNSPHPYSRDLLDANPFCKLKRLAPSACLVSLERTWLALLNCGRVVHWNLEIRTKSFWKAFTEKPNVVQLGTTLLLVGLLFEVLGYLRQPHIDSGQIVEVSIITVFSSLALSEKVAWINPPSNDTALDAQSLFLYSDSDLEQMITVERLVAGSSYAYQNVQVVFKSSRPSRAGKHRKKPGRTENSRRSRRSNDSLTLSGSLAMRRCRNKCVRCYF